MSEGELVHEAVRRARLGDPEALHFLYVRFAAEVEDAARRRGAAAEEAERAATETFGGLADRIAEYQPGTGSFGDWLMALVRLPDERRAA